MLMSKQKKKMQESIGGEGGRDSGADCTGKLNFASVVFGPWEPDLQKTMAISLQIILENCEMIPQSRCLDSVFIFEHLHNLHSGVS